MATNPITERKTYGFSDDPTFDVLLNQLASLAGEWRETKSIEPLRKYQAILKSLIEMGRGDELDFELTLPRDYMPLEYLKRCD